MKQIDKPGIVRPLALILLVVACVAASCWRCTAPSRDLAHERDLCRKAGLPLSITEWASAHVPTSQDSVPDYVTYDAARSRHDLSDADMALATHLAFGHAPSNAEAKRLGSVLEARKDVFAAMDLALTKPLYSFGKDPDPQAIANGFAPMARRREAVMLVCARGILQAHAHRFDEGAQTTAKGYRIGRQIGSISSLMGQAYTTFMDTITSESLGVILGMAGTDLHAAEALRYALRTAPTPTSLSFGFSQYCGECCDSFRRLRSGEYDDFLAFFPYGDPGRYTDPALWGREPRTFILRHVPFTFHAMVDSVNAASLRTTRNIVAHADRPYPERRDWIRSQSAALSPHDPDNAHPRLLLEDFASASIDDASALAHRSVVLAAANVLVYRARMGRLPYHLSEADPEMPIDPFTGQPLRYRLDGKGGFTVASVGQSAEGVGPDGYRRPPVRFHWAPPR